MYFRLDEYKYVFIGVFLCIYCLYIVCLSCVTHKPACNLFDMMIKYVAEKQRKQAKGLIVFSQGNKVLKKIKINNDQLSTDQNIK